MINDVAPTRDGYRATCECGQSRLFPDQTDAWTWLLDHPCSAVDES